MIIYGLKTCDTCRKAIKSLTEAGIALQFADVRADGIPDDVMRKAYAQFGEALLNTRSTTWRGLSEAERGTPPLELLARHPALMKRPLIDAQTTLYLGWTSATKDALLGKE
ncbi:MAG: ArsC/Spx/MgsR family protein [Pseudomonadota bacterium]